MDSSTAPIVYTAEEMPKFAQSAAIANYYAQQSILQDYQALLSDETIRRQKRDLTLFKQFLIASHLLDSSSQVDYYTSLTLWQGVEQGHIKAFREWMLREGHAIGSVNVRLATIRRYVQLACNAGYIPAEVYAQICQVKGFKHKDGIRTDTKRDVKRIGSKKAKSTTLTIEQVRLLKRQKDIKDRLIMCLLADHGFRVGDVCLLRLDDIDMTAKKISIVHQKNQECANYTCSPDTYAALQAYLREYRPASYLLVNSMGKKYSPSAMSHHVAVIGRKAGIINLSPHDLRHFMAWFNARQGAGLHDIKRFGAWRSLEMADRYIGEVAIANEQQRYV